MQDVSRRNGISPADATAITSAFQHEHPRCTIDQFGRDDDGSIYFSSSCGLWFAIRTRAGWGFRERIVVASRERSNQAMQRTAGRAAFPLAMTSTFNPQLRSPSPAVADLVSR